MDELSNKFFKCKLNSKWNCIKLNIKNIIKTKNKFLSIIEILNLNVDIMSNCYFEIMCISKKYPPQKNENKFIYGKLIEISLINAFNKIGFNCNDLDDNHLIGSEYLNDTRILGIDISIKSKLNKGSGNIIMINKNSDHNHIIKIETIVCIVNEGLLYFIPSYIVDVSYISNKNSKIEYKSSLLTLIDKKHKNFIYKFPKLTDEQSSFTNNLSKINIYSTLYEQLQKEIAQYKLKLK